MCRKFQGPPAKGASLDRFLKRVAAKRPKMARFWNFFGQNYLKFNFFFFYPSRLLFILNSDIYPIPRLDSASTILGKHNLAVQPNHEVAGLFGCLLNLKFNSSRGHFYKKNDRVTEWQTPKGTQYMGGWNLFVPDFNKLPYSLH